MAFDTSLADRVRYVLAPRKSIAEKKMFGGLAFLLNGNLLVAVRKNSLLVRVGQEQNEDALREPHASAFRMKGRGAIKGWVLVESGGFEDDSQLKDWIDRATQFSATLPAK